MTETNLAASSREFLTTAGVEDVGPQDRNAPRLSLAAMAAMAALGVPSSALPSVIILDVDEVLIARSSS